MSLDYLDGIFTKDEIRLPLVADPGNLLNSSDYQKINHLLKQFLKAFPQLHVTVYFTSLKSHLSLSVRECSFWLINRQKTPDIEGYRDKRFSILLLIDDYQKSASIIIGYGLESILSERAIASVLEVSREALAQKAYLKAITLCLGSLAKLLMQHTLPASAASNDPMSSYG